MQVNTTKQPNKPLRTYCKNGKQCMSHGLAKRVAAKLSERDNADITPYYCKTCKKFHVGHTPYWKRVRYASK